MRALNAISYYYPEDPRRLSQFNAGDYHPMSQTVLVTGGAGYIGSTICSALEDAGHHPVVLDSLVGGDPAMVGNRPFYLGDIGDPEVIAGVFSDHPDIGCTIHCAALATVPESVERPLDYYANNVSGSIDLFRNVLAHGCARIVFSSSASVYDASFGPEVTETSPVRPLSPYARSKLMVEMILEDLAAATAIRALSLRYFNPIGADPKMRSGQTQNVASQILGVLVEVASGKRPGFQVTGTDWPTRDGTGIRDYVHVWDLAVAHVAAVERLDEIFPDGGGCDVINLGTGSGVTVREFLSAFENVLGRRMPSVDAPPRPGDIAGAYANVDKARHVLGWRPTLTLEDGIRHALEWDERDHS